MNYTIAVTASSLLRKIERKSSDDKLSNFKNLFDLLKLFL